MGLLAAPAPPSLPPDPPGMNWDHARRLLHLAGEAGGGGAIVGEAVFDPVAEVCDTARAASLCIASGKGGTGKSVVTASLATLFARAGRTLIVDADLGVGNAHILQNVTPQLSFVDVVDGRLGVSDIRVRCREGLDLLGGGSGVSRMAGLSSWEMHAIARGIETVETEYRRLLVDSAAGISSQTISFAAASDVVLIVTTPDVTALTDAYAFLKALLQRRSDCEPLFAVNRATSEEEAQLVAERMIGVSRKFLGREPRFAGALPEDLDAIWGDENWHRLMDALVRASLVERVELGRDAEHFSTFPFVAKYAERLLTDDDRTLFAVRTCERFAGVSQWLYEAIRTERAADAYALLTLEEDNLWACIDLKRPSRPKRDDEEGSPIAYVATYLPQILLFVDRAHDGIRAAEQGGRRAAPSVMCGGKPTPFKR